MKKTKIIIAVCISVVIVALGVVAAFVLPGMLESDKDKITDVINDFALAMESQNPNDLMLLLEPSIRDGLNGTSFSIGGDFLGIDLPLQAIYSLNDLFGGNPLTRGDVVCKIAIHSIDVQGKRASADVTMVTTTSYMGESDTQKERDTIRLVKTDGEWYLTY